MMASSTRALSLPVRSKQQVPALVILAILATLLPMLSLSQAEAAPPTPKTPSFGKAIESYAAYEPNTVCDPVNRPGATKIASLIRATYGSDESIGIARNACYTTSEHNDGRALDWMVDATTRTGRAKANAFLDWLLATDRYGNTDAMARRLGVMYIIFNRRIWRAYDGGHWGEYTGTNPHTDHIHISLSFDGSTGRTSFWTGKPLARPCTTASLMSSAPPVETDPMKYVPVEPTRLASTESGAGTLNGPCRLFHGSGRRLDVQAAGAGPVPGRGVGAVALQVAMRRPNWKSSLTAGPAGGSIPAVKRVSADQNQIASTQMVLPVGADGKVSFFSDFGATDVAVTVLGYYVDPDAPLSVRRRIAADGGNQFDAVHPARVAKGLKLGRSEAATVEVAGRAGIDPAATSASITITVTGGSGRGSLFAYPAGSTKPRLPTLSYNGNQTTVQTTMPLGRGGAIKVENSGSAARTFHVDVSGAYEPVSLSGGRGLAVRRGPTAVVDTASDLQLKALSEGSTKDFSLGDAVPRDTDAVLLQVTARRASEAGWLTFWRPGSSRPDTTDLSVARNGMVTGTVVAAVGEGRKVRVHNTAARGVDVRITVLGAFH